MAEHIVRSLHHIRRDLDEGLELLLLAIESKDFETIMALDLSELIALGPRIDAVAAAITTEEGGESAATSLAVASALSTADVANQSAVASVTSSLAGSVSNLETAAGLSTSVASVSTSLPPVPEPFSVAPVNFTVGQAAPETTLAITGGTAPFTVSNLPAGVTSNGVTIADDGSAVAGTTDATVTDSTGATASLVVTVA